MWMYHVKIIALYIYIHMKIYIYTIYIHTHTHTLWPYTILWPPDAKNQLIGKHPDAGKDWKRRRGQQRIRWLYSIIDSMDMNLGKLWKMVKDREVWSAAVHGLAKSWVWLSNWTIAIHIYVYQINLCVCVCMYTHILIVSARFLK